MKRFSEQVEEQCRRIVRNVSVEGESVSPVTGVRREMALLLSEVDSIKDRRENEQKQLLRRELDLGSQILNLRDRLDLIPSWLERTRAVNDAQQRLDQLRAQMHRLSWESESSLQRIRIRLLELWNFHDQLAEEDGNK